MTPGLARSGLRVTAIMGSLAVLGSAARADDRSLRPPVQLGLDACIDGDRDAIQRAVRIELGDDAPATDDAHAVLVRVACAADGIDGGVVIEVRQPGNPRRYRYALDWHAQPTDTRPRLLGLAIAEAVEASRIELTAVPERAAPEPTAGPVARVPVARSSWTLSVLGGQRWFAADHGLGLLGLGLMPGRRLSRRLRLALDVTAETTTVVVPSGVLRAASLSSAPQISYELLGRPDGGLRAEIGVGMRVGVVRMVGEAIPGAELVAGRLVRAWFGPTATAAVGFGLAPSVSLDASVELGVVTAGATARDLGEPVAAIGGPWTSLRVAATIAL